MKHCPFNKDECNCECALFISPDDINDLVSSRLTSIGVFDKKVGLCTLKVIGLSTARHIFERTSSSGRL